MIKPEAMAIHPGIVVFIQPACQIYYKRQKRLQFEAWLKQRQNPDEDLPNVRPGGNSKQRLLVFDLESQYLAFLC